MSEPTTTLLEVSDLWVFRADSQEDSAALRGISLQVRGGEILAIVGGSGSGKTTLVRAILGLLPEAETRGSIRWKGQSLLRLSDRQWRQIRGRQIGFVPQEAMSALNPFLTVGGQLRESQRVGSEGAPPHRDDEAARSILAQLKIDDPDACLRAYPHQLSGGMRQRVALALALIPEPHLLIADEPTTAVDVFTQSHLGAHLLEIQRQRKLSILLISHDLSLVSGLADRCSVMAEGRIVETAPIQDLFEAPRHPYTQELLRATLKN